MSLELLLENLNSLKKTYSKKKTEYHVPGIWADPFAKSDELVVNPFDFFIESINKLDKIKSNESGVTYNMFVRYTCAFSNYVQSSHKNFPEESFRNQGTFLKAIAIIPYLKSLGVDRIHLLPITKIGIDGKKGDLGSPYAIRNHYEIDEGLCEPILSLTPEEQFGAFMEACKKTGIKVILEFVFRTASIDNDLSIEKPEWFYWIKGTSKFRSEENPGGFGPPQFNKRDLKKINEKIEESDLTELPDPDSKYQAFYTNIPVQVARVEQKVIGLLKATKKPLKTNECIIAPAFADWPPDDNQPPWSDVTYLRLFDDPKFNYMAYNTIRMYDEELNTEENIQDDLWDYLSDILPYFINKFDINGAMVDMGHALPSELRKRILEKAKNVKSDFIFWEENFVPSIESFEEGYSAATGYMMFDSLNAEKLKRIISESAEFPIDFFATPENHNTPRAYYKSKDKRFSEFIYVIMKLLPQITYIHSGFELFEKQTVNTGLGFTDEEISENPSDSLPLFSYAELDWSQNELLEKIRIVNEIIDSTSIEINLIENSNSNSVCFEAKLTNGKNISFIGNLSKEMTKIEFEQNGQIILSNKKRPEDDVFNGFEYLLIVN